MKNFLEYLPVRSKHYTVRALARTLAERIIIDQAGYGYGTLTRLWQFPLPSNVAAVYSFDSFNESITKGSQSITDWNMFECILPALKATEVTQFMALLDRRGRIWMIREINLESTFHLKSSYLCFFKLKKTSFLFGILINIHRHWSAESKLRCEHRM